MSAAAQAVTFPADDADGGECRAIEIAAELVRLHGPLALSRAQQVRDKAATGRRLIRADLYGAVCVVIADRDRVFSRSRGPFYGIERGAYPIASDAA